MYFWCFICRQNLKVRIALVPIFQLSGRRTNFYSFRFEGEEHNEFEKFIMEYSLSQSEETKNLYLRLKSIGKSDYLIKYYFKNSEGDHPSQPIYAAFDNPDKVLRLYCIHFGDIIILGSGGVKGPDVHKWEDDEILCKAARHVILVYKYLKRLEDEIELASPGEVFQRIEFDTEGL